MEADDFMQWWKLVQPNLLKILKRYTAFFNSATDLAQDLAYIAWKRRSSFNDFEHFGVHTTFVQKRSLMYYTHNFSSTPFA
jgi:hypothetical protein